MRAKRKQTAWSRVKKYFAAREGKTVLRKRFISSKALKGISVETLDRYRRYLNQGFYLDTEARGKYFVMEAPQKDLTINDNKWFDCW